ncbi:hypothetical protein OnM2_049061 [Erysiphe neolycopersici]|uniref:Uncharacterized protein n=1 Tax=Erysiphe neolycopersici TaxID=212602 RepID=A0A420HT69_9PEZI|nr:hypothetical protein OnM2_049061 [Erysiphe neolycopersici]
MAILEWGSPTSFDFFMLRLKIRAQDEVKVMVSGEMICLNMVKSYTRC